MTGFAKLRCSCGAYSLDMKGVIDAPPTTIVHDVFLESSAGTLKTAQGIISTSNPAHIVFSDNTLNKTWGGKNLANFIKKKELGSIVASPSAKNPNYPNHEIVVWVWTPDWAAIKKFCK